MKTYVITLSEAFLQGHPKAGQPTYFTEQFQNTFLKEAGISACDCCAYPTRDCENCAYKHIGFSKCKIHTIRGNYNLWVKRIAKVKAGEAILSVRRWLGVPYRSKQVEIARLTKADGVGVQSITFQSVFFDTNWIVGQAQFSDQLLSTVAHNDGLSLQDFRDWFKGYDLTKPMAIIHFTPFRY